MIVVGREDSFNNDNDNDNSNNRLSDEATIATNYNVKNGRVIRRNSNHGVVVDEDQQEGKDNNAVRIRSSSASSSMFILLVPLAVIGIVDAISYMIVTPTLLFYVLSVGGNTASYGFIFSIYSFSSFCFKPILGYWSDQTNKTFRVQYLCSILFAMLGGFLYFFASQFTIKSSSHHDGSIYNNISVFIIFMGRMLGGFGDATTTLGYSYMASTIQQNQLTKIYSILGMIRLLGMGIGQISNMFVSSLNNYTIRIPTSSVQLVVTPYNSIGLVLLTINTVSFLVVYFILKEPQDIINDTDTDTDHGSENENTTVTASTVEVMILQKEEQPPPQQRSRKPAHQAERVFSSRLDSNTKKAKKKKQKKETDDDVQVSQGNNNDNDELCHDIVVTSWKQYVTSILQIHILIPLYIFFTINSNFQLLEIGIPPAANNILQWNSVAISTIFAFNAVELFLAIAIRYQLSSYGITDEILVFGGSVLSIIGYSLVYSNWKFGDTSILQFMLPIILSTFAYPFIGAPIRAIYTRAISNKNNTVLLCNHQGTLQAFISMIGDNIAGFITPIYISTYVLRTRNDIINSHDDQKQRQFFTQYALFAPIQSTIGLFGILYFIIVSNQQQNNNNSQLQRRTSSATVSKDAKNDKNNNDTSNNNDNKNRNDRGGSSSLDEEEHVLIIKPNLIVTNRNDDDETTSLLLTRS